MNVKEVDKLLTVRPFEPFGIYMSEGSAYPVTHPDQVILTTRVAHVGIGSSRNGRVVRDVVIWPWYTSPASVRCPRRSENVASNCFGRHPAIVR